MKKGEKNGKKSESLRISSLAWSKKESFWLLVAYFDGNLEVK